MPTEALTSSAAGGHGPFVHHNAFMRRVLNPIAARIPSFAVLYVRGRRSGKRLSVPMDPPFEWQGRRYLVAPLGDTHWARNLRAAGEAEMRIRGHLERFTVTELKDDERDDIVIAYANTITCGCREYLEKLPDPADHPVFRIEPSSAAR